MISRLLTVLYGCLAAGSLLAADCEEMGFANAPLLKGEVEYVENHLVGVMAGIPGGDFCMGDMAGNGEADELPVHVEHVGTFLLATHEVTREQFARFVTATGFVSDAERDDAAQVGCLAVDPNVWTFKYRANYNWAAPGFQQSATHPVVCVSYNDALAYIAWLKQETDLSYRLPTEAEWEYVARAGTSTIYPWGDSAVASCAYANVADRSAWPGHSKSPFGRIDCDDGYAFTAPVGSFKANALGLFDISGNVWEWNAGCWAKGYAVDSKSSVCKLRPFRSSSWMNSEKSLRSANRSKNGPSDRLNTVGFRLALDYTAH